MSEPSANPDPVLLEETTHVADDRHEHAFTIQHWTRGAGAGGDEKSRAERSSTV